MFIKGMASYFIPELITIILRCYPLVTIMNIVEHTCIIPFCTEQNILKQPYKSSDARRAFFASFYFLSILPQQQTVFL